MPPTAEIQKLAATLPEFDQRLAPNASMGAAIFAACLVLAVCVPTIAGVVFASLGAWLVLPFAGLEAGLLITAWVWERRRTRAYERIVVEAGRIRIERGIGRRRVEHIEINQAWARLLPVESALDYRLIVRAHGRDIEIGCHLDAEGRRALARDLREKLAR